MLVNKLSILPKSNDEEEETYSLDEMSKDVSEFITKYPAKKSSNSQLTKMLNYITIY